jgi:peroxiredoxin
MSLCALLAVSTVFSATAWAAPKKSPSKSAHSKASNSPTPAPNANEAVVQSRPLIAGDLVVNAKLRDNAGKSVELKDILADKYTVLIYSNPSDLTSGERVGYFEILDPPLEKLGYQFVLVSSSVDTGLPDKIRDSVGLTLLIDESHVSFEDMGLADVAAKKAPTRSGIFLVDPKGMILFEFSSSSRRVPLSSEVLVLAARVYRDYSKTELEAAKK